MCQTSQASAGLRDFVKTMYGEKWVGRLPLDAVKMRVFGRKLKICLLFDAHICVSSGARPPMQEAEEGIIPCALSSCRS